VPAKPEFLHLMRAVVASVGARGDLSYDDIDDLQIAIDEAGSYLLAVASEESEFELRVDSDAHLVSATIQITNPAGQWPPSRGEDSLAWKVLSGLMDRAEFLIDDASPGISLSKGVVGGVVGGVVTGG
jgi:serine/threonine-protein kinase RsbW